AEELQSRARLRRKEMSRDQDAIYVLVAAACSPDNDYGERHKSLSTLAADHGEFAVPALVAKLADDDTRVQDYAIVSLYYLGTVATLPLIEAMQSENPLVRRNAAAALSHIEDPRALPTLLAAASNDRAEEVRFVASRACERMNAGGANAVDRYLALVDRYMTGRTASDPSEVVWELRDGALHPVEVPTSVFPLRVAQKFAYAAWRTDPASSAAQAAYARALLAEAAAIEAALAAAGEDAPESLTALANAPAELRVKAVALGPAVLRQALAEAREKGMAPVAVECAQLLGRVEDRASLASSPLIDGLNDDDKRVAYACALAIAEASDGVDVPHAADVVRVLGAAVTEESLRTVLVVDGSEAIRRTATEAFAKGRGTVVEAAAGGTEAVGSLITFPVVDAVVINQDLPDVVPEHVIGLIRKDPRLANTKVLVVATDEDQAATRFGDRVDGIIKGPLTGEALTQKVNEVLEGVDLGHKRKWAESIAASASAALAELSQKGADVSGATKQLAGQLSRADAVAIPAAKALALAGTSADLPALIDAITGAGSVELRKAAADAAGSILQRAGKASPELIDKLAAAVADADPELRLAIVGALGRAGLKSGDHLKLVNTIEAALNGGRNGASTEAARLESDQ
ncbi:MAG TPA: HEAT repeat domain-containing protein, partial [Planctomycetota bacterium]|nr:HEAT repeat domain-containing protein [Planctomycetota bacterium]